MTVITQRITWHNDKWSSCIECTCTWSGHLCAYDLAETRNVEIVKLLVCTDESHKHTCCENHSNTNKFFSKLSPTRTSQVCDLAECHSLWPRRTSQSLTSLSLEELKCKFLAELWDKGDAQGVALFAVSSASGTVRSMHRSTFRRLRAASRKGELLSDTDNLPCCWHYFSPLYLPLPLLPQRTHLFCVKWLLVEPEAKK